MDFLSGKSFEEFKRELSAKKKKIKDDLGLIPARIDEVTRSIPEEKDYSELEKELKSIETQIFEIEGMISDISKRNESSQKERIAIQNEYFTLKQRQQSIEFQAKQSIQDENNKSVSGVNELKRKVESLNNELENLDHDLYRNNESLKLIDSKLPELRKEWETENGKTLIFDDDEFICSTCKRLYETDDIESKKTELTANFNKDKVKKLGEIDQKGLFLVKQKEDLTKVITGIKEKEISIKKERDKLQAEIDKLSSKEVKQITSEEFLSKSVEYQDLLSQIKILEEKLSQPKEGDSDDKLLSDKKELQVNSDEIKTQLSQKDAKQKAEARIKELETEMRTLSQQLASLEKTEFVIDDFTRTKMNMVESKINSMFKLVRFKMFNTLINGGIEDACETLINGVPYPDANNAGKINAGRDIVNTLSSFYSISAPIFTDNAESINDLMPVNSQDIRLVVTKDKQLIIS
jgi:chromosome segregation ATPase